MIILRRTKQEHYDKDLKAINKKLAFTILPIAIENGILTIGVIISMGMIGRLDVISFNSIGIAVIFTQIVTAIFRGISIGEIVYVSRFYGEGNLEKLREVIQQTLLSSIILGVVASLLIYGNTRELLAVFDLENQFLLKTEHYLRVIVFGLPFLAINITIGAVFQGVGKASTSMIITLMMNTIYLALGYVLIFGKLGVPIQGLTGAAVALVSSQIIAAVTSLILLIREKGILNNCLNKEYFRLKINHVKNVCRIGLPASMETILWQIAIMIVTKVMLNYGEFTYAAYQLSMSVEAISYMPATGFGIAATAFISQSLGAKNQQLANTYLKQMLKGVFLTTSVCVIAFLAVPKELMMLLTDKTEIISLGAKYLFIMAFIEIPLNLTGVYIGAMRGLGCAKVPIIISLTGLWGLRVPLILVVSYCFKLPVTVCWAVIGVDVLFRFVLSSICFRKESKYHFAN